MRVSNHILCDGVSPLAIGVDDAETERMWIGSLDLRVHVTLFLMNKRLPVGGHVLDIAQLGTINRGVEDFSDNAAKDRKPQAAAARVRSADAILIAMRPFG